MTKKQSITKIILYSFIYLAYLVLGILIVTSKAEGNDPALVYVFGYGAILYSL